MDKIDFPSEFEWLFEEARYKVAHGGRWSWKSWSVAKYIIIRCVEKATRVFCGREVQKSIKESVHNLLKNTIKELNYSHLFTVLETSISCHNGSYIFYDGLLRNVHNIKSLEDVDICWVEEAQNVSEQSWVDLTPTIRKDNSEIIVTFNRKYEDDATDVRFIKNPPKNSIVKEINYTDIYNDDELPTILKDEIEDCIRRDPTLTSYKQIYLNKPVGVGSKIWTTFNRDIHVLHEKHRLYKALSMQYIQEYGNCYMAMDPHSRYYPFIVWGARVPAIGQPGEYYTIIYNEWPRIDTIGDYYSELRKKLYYNGSIADLSKIIYSSDGAGEIHPKIYGRFVDSRFAKGAGGQNWSTSTEGMVQVFAKPENGGIVLTMPKERVIDVQRDNIIDEMKYNHLIEISDFNTPMYFIMPWCKNVIQSLENHRCEEESEKEDEKYKDPSDALRILNAGMQDIDYIKNDRQKKQEHIVGLNDTLKQNMLSLTGTYQ